MSRIKPITFFDETGKLIRTVTDPKTTKTVDTYNLVYHCADKFSIEHETQPSDKKQYVHDVLVASSNEMGMTIVCIKDFIPGVSENILDHARYHCGIINHTTGKVKQIEGGVESLYYKLFRGRIK